MKKILYLLFLINFSLCFSQINIEEIKKNVTENPQKYFYDYLDVFKKDPSKLTQEELNQLYYGSRFIEYDTEISDSKYKEVWEAARNRLSKKKAEKILSKAEESYSKNLLDKSILIGISNIYRALGDDVKKELCMAQYNAIVDTIEKSGTGDSEDSPICVIWAGDVISRINDLRGYGTISDFKQDMKSLPDGSMLTIYSLGVKKIYVKLIGGFR